MKKIIRLFVVFFVCGLSGMIAFAEPSIIISEGKYVMGDLDTRKDAKTQALIEAKRMAMEKAGTYLQSTTEVKNFKLSKDQINTIAAGIMSVEILNEDWKMSGDNMVLTIQIRATVDTSNLKDRISKMQEGDNAENFKEVQSQLAALQKELAELKKQAQQQADSTGTKKQPSQEIKEKHEALVKDMSAWEYMGKGVNARVDQRWEESAEAFGQVIALNPRISDAYAGKAFALYNLKKQDEALELVNKALAIDPVSAKSLGVKALILKDQPGKVDLAMDTINQAIKLQPNLSQLYGFRGGIFMKMGKFHSALADFAKACQMGMKESCVRAKGLEEKMKAGKRRN
jgi:Skp family chaperone for outer membrane proteins